MSISTKTSEAKLDSYIERRPDSSVKCPIRIDIGNHEEDELI